MRRTPVLVGVGVATQREDDPERALEPLDLMLTAVRSAEADALPAPAALLAGAGRIGPTPAGADRSHRRHRYRDSIFAFLIAPTQSGS